MSEPDKKTNWVTFRLTNWETNFVHMNGASITRGGGLEPDSWTFVVSASELSKLGIDDDFPDVSTTPIVGELALWYQHEPSYDLGSPADVVLGNVAIISIEPNEIETIAGDEDASTISYCVTIMDHRRLWVEPRGARLDTGMMNRYPLAPGETLHTNKQLIEMCADAMGVTVTVPSGVNDAEPARNLEWRGEHAPTAMQELLEHAGFVYCPLISGVGQIMLPGSGSAPSIPSGRLIRSTTVKSIDRRPRKVVLTSAPAAKIHTFDGTAAEPAAWHFVIQDPADDQWKKLEDVATLTSAGGAAAVWANQGYSLSETERSPIMEQLYRCIQLDTDAYPIGKASLLNQWFDVDLVQRVPSIGPTAAPEGLVTQRADGSWGSHNDEQPILVKQVLSEVNVLVFPHPLVMLVEPSEDVSNLNGSNSEPFDEENLKPTFSVEAWNEDAIERAVFGFSVSSFSLTTMSESAAKDLLTGARDDTGIFTYDDLLQVIINPNDSSPATNRTAIETRAESYARQLVPLATPAMEIMLVKGFLQVELTGAVSEVEYDCESVTTKITLNGWHCPARIGRDSHSGGSISTGESSPARSITKRRSKRRDAARRRSLSRSSKLGLDNTAKLVEPTRPQPPAVQWPKIYLVTGATPISGQKGRYTGSWMTWLPQAGATGDLAAGNIGGSAGAVEIWHAPDIEADEPTLESTDIMFAVEGPKHTSRDKVIMITIGSAGASKPSAIWLKVTGVASTYLTTKAWNGTTTSGDDIFVLPTQGHAVNDLIYAVESVNGTEITGTPTVTHVEVLNIDKTTDRYKVMQAIDTTGRLGMDWVRAH